MSSFSVSELIPLFSAVLSGAFVFFKLERKHDVLKAEFDSFKQWHNESKEDQKRMNEIINRKLDTLNEQIAALSHQKEPTRQPRKSTQ